jgi:hypothetical protein
MAVTRNKEATQFAVLRVDASDVIFFTFLEPNGWV